MIQLLFFSLLYHFEMFRMDRICVNNPMNRYTAQYIYNFCYKTIHHLPIYNRLYHRKLDPNLNVLIHFYICNIH